MSTNILDKYFKIRYTKVSLVNKLDSRLRGNDKWNMFKNVLNKAGLTPTQVDILEYLYKKKQARASEIARKIKKSRAIVYKDLEELALFGVIERDDKPNQISLFKITHPSQMEKLFDEREQTIKKDRELFNNYLPDMVSKYNLINNKPGVRFYEGLEGVKKVIFDTLSADEVVYTYADMEKVNKYIRKINEDYAKKRDKLDIKKKALIVDSDYSRKFFKDYHKQTTDIKFVKGVERFATVMQIYSNKISYITLSDESMIGVIIEDKNIYQMHRTLFEKDWKLAKEIV